LSFVELYFWVTDIAGLVIMAKRFRLLMLVGCFLSVFCTEWLSADGVTLRSGAGDSLTLSWPSVVDQQHQVYCTDDLSTPLAQWEVLGDWQVGDGNVLSLVDAIGDDTQKFYIVDERSEFIIDTANFGYETVGNSWTYSISDSREGADYTATYTVMGTQEFLTDSGQNVVRLEASRPDDGSWEQVLYILNDFSKGIFQVGGISPANEQFPGVFTNTANASTPSGVSVEPLLLNAFTPGVEQDWDYNNSAFNDIDNAITHELTTISLPALGVDPVTAIKVSSNYISVIEVVRSFIFFNVDVTVDVTSRTEDYYVAGVGLVKKVVDVDAEPQDSTYNSFSEYIDVTYTLDSYSNGE